MILPIRLIRRSGRILIAAGLATLATLSVDGATLAKVQYHAKPRVSVAVKPLPVAPNVTVDSPGSGAPNGVCGVSTDGEPCGMGWWEEAASDFSNGDRLSHVSGHRGGHASGHASGHGGGKHP